MGPTSQKFETPRSDLLDGLDGALAYIDSILIYILIYGITSKEDINRLNRFLDTVNSIR